MLDDVLTENGWTYPVKCCYDCSNNVEDEKMMGLEWIALNPNKHRMMYWMMQMHKGAVGFTADDGILPPGMMEDQWRCLSCTIKGSWTG
jgi:hypothetical protein